MSARRVFISRVSRELGPCAEDLRNALQSIEIASRTQLSFRQEPDAEITLEKLSKYIAASDIVISLIGCYSGGFPDDDVLDRAVAVAMPDRDRHPITWRQLLPTGFVRLSYTQWEIILARHWGKILFLYHAQGYKPASPPVPGIDDLFQQQDFIDRFLRGRSIDRATFANSDRLCRNALCDLWPSEVRDDDVRTVISHYEHSYRRVVAITLSGLALVGGGIAIVKREIHLARQEQQAGLAEIKAGQKITPASFRAELSSASEAMFQRALSDANDAKGGFEEREKHRKVALAAREERRSIIDDLVETYSGYVNGQDETPEWNEFIRIVTVDKDIDAALRYIGSRRDDIFQRAAVKSTEAERQLLTLLRAAKIALVNGRNDDAESILRALVLPPHSLPEAYEELWNFLVNIKGPVVTASGTLAAASKIFEESKRLADRQLLDGPENRKWQNCLAVSHERLGKIEVERKDYEEAGNHFRSALSLWESLVQNGPADMNYFHNLISIHINLGDLAEAEADLQEATFHFAHGLNLVEEHLEAKRDCTLAKSQISIILERLGDLELRNWHDLDEAKRRFAAMVRMRKEIASRFPNNKEAQRNLAIAYLKFGDLASEEYEFDEGDRVLRESLLISQNLATAEPQQITWQRDVAICLGRLGDIAKAKGNLDEAFRFYTESLSTIKRIAILDNENLKRQDDVVYGLMKLGDIGFLQMKYKECKECYYQVLRIRKGLAEADPQNTKCQEELADVLDALGEIALRTSSPDEAVLRYSEAISVYEDLGAKYFDGPLWQEVVGKVCETNLILSFLEEKRGDSVAVRERKQAAHDALESIQIRGFVLLPKYVPWLRALKQELNLNPAEESN